MVSRFSQQNYSISEDQISQILDAILSGKYSWACVLMLQSAGYNPLNYIPYRTYNRLMKENGYGSERKRQKNKKEGPLEVNNLPHLRSLKDSPNHINGGSGWLGIWERSSFWKV